MRRDPNSQLSPEARAELFAALQAFLRRVMALPVTRGHRDTGLVSYVELSDVVRALEEITNGYGTEPIGRITEEKAHEA